MLLDVRVRNWRSLLESLVIRKHLPTLAVGYAMRSDDIVAQAGDSDVLFHCANVPNVDGEQTDSARRISDGGGRTACD